MRAQVQRGAVRLISRNSTTALAGSSTVPADRAVKLWPKPVDQQAILHSSSGNADRRVVRLPLAAADRSHASLREGRDDPAQALEVLRALKSQGSWPPPVNAVSALAQQLAAKRDVARLSELMVIFSRSTGSPEACGLWAECALAVYEALAVTLSRNGDIRGALAALEGLRNSGLAVPIRTYAKLAAICAEARIPRTSDAQAIAEHLRVKKVFEVEANALSEMENGGLERDERCTELERAVMPLVMVFARAATQLRQVQAIGGLAALSELIEQTYDCLTGTLRVPGLRPTTAARATYAQALAYCAQPSRGNDPAAAAASLQALEKAADVLKGLCEALNATKERHAHREQTVAFTPQAGGDLVSQLHAGEALAAEGVARRSAPALAAAAAEETEDLPPVEHSDLLAEQALPREVFAAIAELLRASARMGSSAEAAVDGILMPWLPLMSARGACQEGRQLLDDLAVAGGSAGSGSSVNGYAPNLIALGGAVETALKGGGLLVSSRHAASARLALAVSSWTHLSAYSDPKDCAVVAAAAKSASEAASNAAAGGGAAIGVPRDLHALASAYLRAKPKPQLEEALDLCDKAAAKFTRPALLNVILLLRQTADRCGTVPQQQRARAISQREWRRRRQDSEAAAAAAGGLSQALTAARLGMAAEALAALQDWRESGGVAENPGPYVLVLRALALRPAVEGGERASADAAVRRSAEEIDVAAAVRWLVEDMAAQGFAPDLQVLNRGLAAFKTALECSQPSSGGSLRGNAAERRRLAEQRRSRLVMEAASLFDRLTEGLHGRFAPVSPDVFSFNLLVRCCVLGGDLSRALEAVETMAHAADPAARPNVVTYTTLIRALARNASMADARAMTVAMTNYGVSPNGATSDALVEGHLREGHVAEAVSTVQHLFNQHGVRPARSLLQRCVSTALRQKEVYEARRAVWVMRQLWPEQDGAEAADWRAAVDGLFEKHGEKVE